MQIPIPEVIFTWQFWITAVAVFILCEIFKQIPAIKNGNVSWVVNLFGILVGVLILCILVGWTGENVVFGILASAASTLAYELWQNILNTVIGKNAELPDTKIGGSD